LIFVFDRLNPALPTGYDFDVCNAEIVRQMTVQDGLLTLPGGMRYRVLVLPDSDRMTLEMLQAIQKLVRNGATVVGRKPAKSPSLAKYPASVQSVQAIANEVWGDCDGHAVDAHAYGAGWINWGGSMADTIEVPADFTSVPELWHPVDGRRETAGSYSTRDGVTTLPLRLDPSGSVFVIFRPPAKPADPIVSVHRAPEVVPVQGVLTAEATPVEIPPVATDRGVVMTAWRTGTYVATTTAGRTSNVVTGEVPGPLELTGSWQVGFPSGVGAPPTATLAQLVSWSDSNDEGIRYFSGTATYRKAFSLDGGLLVASGRIYLDLGTVKNVAEVSLNGHEFPVLWKPPFRVDITGAARTGENQLVVKVTNLWPNRLIGDQRLPVEQRVTWSSFSHYRPDSPLLPSGLLGPVLVRFAREVTLLPAAQ